MAGLAPSPSRTQYQQILGVRFFIGDALEAVEIGTRGGLVVVPAAPALLELERDADYRQALLDADLAITDSGLLVMYWNLFTRQNIHRVSGLEYLRLLLQKPELKNPGSTLWVMPSVTSMHRNLDWLQREGYPFSDADCYIAPKYPKGPIHDDKLVEIVNDRRPRHVIICVGGGVQEKLGHCLKRRSAGTPAIHCIGAAIGFLSGDQVRIPHWADQQVLGWLFRCASDPKRFVPRYVRALALLRLLWRFGHRMPDIQA
ncbi:MAG TPA: WecB/TagA/CpsF family glycosyltransferase [Verrucomicrobiae bacterium]|jgi:UDP-N-acetyl-D-mannosaminuronic acid transferase (WecB/TagA/CpsF family)